MDFCILERPAGKDAARALRLGSIGWWPAAFLAGAQVAAFLLLSCPRGDC